MYHIREFRESDASFIANFEIQISIISFGDKAITDPSFHLKKLLKAKDKSGMMVLSTSDDKEVLGWLWMEKRRNSITEEIYVNFKSFYIVEKMRGHKAVDVLLERGIDYSKTCGATYIVGKVHAQNIPMRSLYKNHCFSPTHITMELNLDDHR